MVRTIALNTSSRVSRDFFMVLSASLLISLFSYIRIPLFFTPVPLVLQNALAVAIGALLGSKKGGLSLLLFLVYGCCNLPVFAGGHFGAAILLSPFSGGYLVGYCAAAFVTGKVLELYPSRFSLACMAGFLTVLVLGTSFLALSIGWGKAFSLGFAPFIVPDILKAAALAKMFSKLQSTRIT